ncbi:unnamed protein product [Gadus morhua 'NCC']
MSSQGNWMLTGGRLDWSPRIALQNVAPAELNSNSRGNLPSLPPMWVLRLSLRNTEEQRCPVRASAGTGQQAHQALETRVLLSKDERRTPGRLLRRGGCGEASGAQLTYSSSTLRGSVTWGHALEQSWRANDPRSLLGAPVGSCGPRGRLASGGAPSTWEINLRSNATAVGSDSSAGVYALARGVLWDLAGDFSQAAKRACLPPRWPGPQTYQGAGWVPRCSRAETQREEARIVPGLIQQSHSAGDPSGQRIPDKTGPKQEELVLRVFWSACTALQSLAETRTQ